MKYSRLPSARVCVGMAVSICKYWRSNDKPEAAKGFRAVKAAMVG